jgi:hypothetical protein
MLSRCVVVLWVLDSCMSSFFLQACASYHLCFSSKHVADTERLIEASDYCKQIKDLQENILRPRLLRRMKDDVEKSIPQKEEVIIFLCIFIYL